MRALIFDLDDTLVDTSESFDLVVCQIVEHHSGTPLSTEELFDLRSRGGFNCDWDASVELLRQRGVALERERVATEGLERYLKIAKNTEELMVELSMLEGLSQKAPLYVVTGRVRAEYQPIWASRLDPIFVEVVCRDDREHLPPKPSPAQVLDLMQRHQISGGFFIGNSVDDMRAGRGAGLTSVGVTTNQSEATLREAGAQLVVAHPSELEELLTGQLG